MLKSNCKCNIATIYNLINKIIYEKSNKNIT